MSRNGIAMCAEGLETSADFALGEDLDEDHPPYDFPQAWSSALAHPVAAASIAYHRRHDDTELLLRCL